jgi:hypothetical protein
MAIVFSNTQGDREITVNDNQLDQTNYSVTLIGKNVTNYGQIIAQNSIRQLENFASTTAPNPGVKLVGQLWFDKTGNHLTVYKNDTEQFEELAYRPKSGTSTPTSSRGSSVQAGEMFFDSSTGTGDLKIYHSNQWNEVLSDLTIRSKVSHVDAGGDGSFAYNNTTGVFTYTGPSAAEVRAHFSGGTGVTYNSSSGVIAIGQAVETTSDVTFNNATIDGNLTVNGTQTILNTETLTVDDNIIKLNDNATGTPSANAGIEIERGDSTNVHLRWNESGDYWEVTRNGTTYEKIYTESEIEGFFSATDAGGDGSFAYNGAGVFTYTGPSTSEVRAHFSAGTNTTYSGGQFSISDATIRSKFSVTDSGGDGSLSYSNGVFTYTGPSASEVRAHLSASGDLSYNSSTGVISFTQRTDAQVNSLADARIQANLIDEDSFSSDSSTRAPSQQSVKAYIATQIATKDHLSELSGSTDDVSEGSTNLYFTNARVNAVLPNTGSLSEGTNLYFTPARVVTAISDNDITTQNIVATGPSGTYNVGSSSVKYGTMYANTFNGTATQAQYADLAELYLADTDYEEGTVLVFGGDAEVTTSGIKASPSIAGVVSHNPAYLMNSELQGDHVTAVALKGRVPVKVVGAVSKGDVLVHSATPGHAEAAENNMNVNGPSCIGIAITDKPNEGAGTVEALVK